MTRKKVLIVEDSLVVREQVSAALAAADYEVVLAGNGVEAIGCVASHRDLAVAVCDVNMPEMDGIELLAALKEKQLLTFPVVMLTAEGRPELLSRARALGAKAWLMKPVVPDRLLSVVDKLTR